MRIVTLGKVTAGALCIAMLTSGCSEMPPREESQPSPKNAFDPHAPHPGTIVMNYAWDRSKVVLSTADLPDAFIFRCADARGQAIAREEAAWCIPVVEVETISRDKAGSPVAPNVADTITSLVYGPGHILLESVESGPSGNYASKGEHAPPGNVREKSNRNSEGQQ